MKDFNKPLAAFFTILLFGALVTIGQSTEQPAEEEPAPNPIEETPTGEAAPPAEDIPVDDPPIGAWITHIEHGGHHARELLDRPVRSPDGTRLGRVENIVMDLQANRLLYIIVDGSAVPETNDETRLLITVPPQAFSVTRVDEEDLLLNVPLYRWENAPIFNPDQLQDLGQAEKKREIYTYFRQEWRDNNRVATEAPYSLTLLTELIGKDVHDPQHRQIGQLENLLVNLPTGRLAFTIISTTALSSSSRFAILQDVVSSAGEPGVLIADIDIQALAEAGEFALTEWMRPHREGESRVFRYGEEQAAAWRGVSRGRLEEALVNEDEDSFEPPTDNNATPTETSGEPF